MIGVTTSANGKIQDEIVTLICSHDSTMPTMWGAAVPPCIKVNFRQ